LEKVKNKVKILDALAECHYQNGDYIKSLQVTKEVFKIRNSHEYEKDDLLTIFNKISLGAAYFRVGHTILAENMFQIFLGHIETCFPENAIFLRHIGKYLQYGCIEHDIVLFQEFLLKDQKMKTLKCSQKSLNIVCNSD
jgi:hypothetical protein